MCKLKKVLAIIASGAIFSTTFFYPEISENLSANAIDSITSDETSFSTENFNEYIDNSLYTNYDNLDESLIGTWKLDLEEESVLLVFEFNEDNSSFMFIGYKEDYENKNFINNENCIYSTYFISDNVICMEGDGFYTKYIYEINGKTLTLTSENGDIIPLTKESATNPSVTTTTTTTTPVVTTTPATTTISDVTTTQPIATTIVTTSAIVSTTTSATTTPQITTTPVVTTTPESTSLNIGDIDNNSSINANDASMILAEYAILATNGKPNFTEAQMKAADVNNDGEVNAIDASLVLAYYAHISTGGSSSIKDFITNKI